MPGQRESERWSVHISARSHDLGDLIAVVDGRASLLSECQASDNELRSYLRDRFSRLIEAGSFWDALPGHLPGDAAS